MTVVKTDPAPPAEAGNEKPKSTGRTALERKDYATIVRSIQDRFPKTLDRLAK